MASIKGLIRNPYKVVFILDKLKISKIIPDKLYLKMKFRATLNKKLNLKSPKTFNEKLQWLKLYNRRSEYTKMVDKYEAKEYVAAMIGEKYIIPTLGVWDRVEDIDFDSLPEQFVLKCTHDSGGIVICRDKENFDIEKAKSTLQKALRCDFYFKGREWPYKNVTPRIIAEKYMEDENPANGLTDYKFFCFHGEPKMIYASQGLENHATANISFYNMQGEELPFHRSDFKPMDGPLNLPLNFSELEQTAKCLAQKIDSPFIRIDLYSIWGKMYFSEITFFPCNGTLPFDPPEWDEKLGEWIKLPE